MDSRVRIATAFLVAGFWLAISAVAAERRDGPPSGDSAVQSDSGAALTRFQGLMTFHMDAEQGKVWLEIPATEGDGLIGRYLHAEGLASGLGSNPVGLDRGELGRTRVIELRRIGNRVVIVEPNLRYRALGDSPAERRAVEQSFAQSVLWAGAVDKSRLSGSELVDLTPFLVSDVHGIAARLQASGQGKFSLDTDRSLLDPEACFAFPDNLDFEVILTYRFDGSNSERAMTPGPLVRETSPTPEAITLRQHHSIIRLPDDGYQPRHFDPRAGSFAIEFADYAAPLDDAIDRRWIVRHRLGENAPATAGSASSEPIVYYVDPGIPEPIRSAVVEGVGWWREAFAAAGFEDGFRVEILPEEVHPLDVRYNVVEWVHRSTRGWSYGGGIIDPRTGEMVKGHVRLGSLRVRQDRLLFEGLAGTDLTGSGEPGDPVLLALARIRQLAAHEVGHTLGLAHNFAASTYGDRASVMDYPAPLVEFDEGGSLDFSRAYGVGVGEWDIFAIRYAYSQFASRAEEAEALDLLVREALAAGLLFLSDDDARPAGAAHPLANLWDNGSDPVARLEHELAVRRRALEVFDETNVPLGRPRAELHEVLVPLYLHHRYQLAAAVKSIGGLVYSYALRGDGQSPARPVTAAEQRRALSTVLQTLEVSALDLPEQVLEQLLPRPAGFASNREMFIGEADPVFDPLAAAATAADMTISALLQPDRAARMVDFHRRDDSMPDFTEVIERTLDRLFAESDITPRQIEIRHRVQQVFVSRLSELAVSQEASPAVRSRAEWGLDQALARLARNGVDSPIGQAHKDSLTRQIQRFLERPAGAAQTLESAPGIPPGDPIGQPSGVAGWGGCSW